MTNSISTTKKAKAKPFSKPRSDFPLFPHATGRWAKKVRGKLVYFGKCENDPKGEAALTLWLDQRDDLLAGRTPRTTGEGLTVRDLCNRFLTAKTQQLETGEITNRTFADYKSTTDRIIRVFGKSRRVDDLASDDFEALRADITKTRGPVALGNEIQRVRVVFKYGYDAGLIEKPMRYGPTFKRPSRRVLRKVRNGNGERMFEAAEVHKMLAAASVQMRAMLLLGLNCGFGNHDCGTLPLSALDLDGGWIDYPRPKTGIKRRCPLWPETIEALRQAIATRPTPKDEADADLVFVTKYGQSWAKETSTNPVSAETRKLIQAIDAAAAKKAKEEGTEPPAKLYRKGLSFYAARHTFETIGGESRDQVAVNHIMGHVDSSMAGVYRERISDDRLRAVVTHVHGWLYEVKK